jgi:hypothetical protein
LYVCTGSDIPLQEKWRDGIVLCLETEWVSRGDGHDGFNGGERGSGIYWTFGKEVRLIKYRFF